MRKLLLFLGGTCGGNLWRNEFTTRLVERGVNEDFIFNPVVPDWTPECQAAEDVAKKQASHCLFYIANPLTPGNEVSAYSLVELVMGLYDNPVNTVGVLDTSDMSADVAKAMNKSFADLKARFPNGNIFDTLDEAVNFLVDQLN